MRHPAGAPFHRWRRVLSPAFACLLLAAAGPASAAEPSRFDGVGRVVAFGDVHGAYDELVSVLRAAGVVDDTLRWSAGNAHLVSLGDLLDRGDGSRKVMDLLRRLEVEALEAGGRVHLVLGNHELMNLTGDLRYVSAGEFAGYAGPEADRRRAAVRARWSDTDETFEARFPPGFFGHRLAFAPDGDYGAWLLEKPAVVVVNGTAYVHGGLSDIIDTTAAELNASFTDQLGRLLQLGGALRRSSVLTRYGDLLDTSPPAPQILDEPERSQWREFAALQRSALFGRWGPLWYRGTVYCHPLLERSRLRAALESLRAERVVVGHTPTATRRIATREDDLVVQADTGMLYSYYRGRPYALVEEGGRWYAVAADGTESPVFDGERSDADLEEILASGVVTPYEGDPERAAPAPLFRVSAGEVSVLAMFVPGNRRQTDRELAAYRLDRLLGLGFVPVTVTRTVAGRRGTLVHFRGSWLNEPDRVAAGRVRENWCRSGSDYMLLNMFDALIDLDRPLEGYTYLAATLELQITGHRDAFDTDRKLIQFPAAHQPALSQATEAVLRGLTQQRLASTIETLRPRQIEALLARRDQLLRTWPRL